MIQNDLTDRQSANLVARAVQIAGGSDDNTISTEEVFANRGAVIRLLSGDAVENPLTREQAEEAVIDFPFYSGGRVTVEGPPRAGFIGRILGGDYSDPGRPGDATDVSRVRSTSVGSDGTTQEPAPSTQVVGGGSNGTDAPSSTDTGGGGSATGGQSGASAELAAQVTALREQVAALSARLAQTGTGGGGGGGDAGGDASPGMNPVVLAAVAVAAYALITGVLD